MYISSNSQKNNMCNISSPATRLFLNSLKLYYSENKQKKNQRTANEINIHKCCIFYSDYSIS